MTKQGSLIIYSGPSGVGKGTILAPLLADESYRISLSVSATTRQPRPGEIDGVHYHFVTKENFLEMISQNEMLEFATYNQHYYGTPKKFVEQLLAQGRNVILEIEVQGAKLVKQRFPNAVMVFVMPPTFDDLRHRLEYRGTETKEQLEGRLNIALDEIKQAVDYDFVIVNNQLEEARTQLLTAVKISPALSRFNNNLIEEVLKDAKTRNE